MVEQVSQRFNISGIILRCRSKSRNYRIALSSFEALRDTLLYHFAKTSSQVGNVYKLTASPLDSFQNLHFTLSHPGIKHSNHHKTHSRL